VYNFILFSNLQIKETNDPVSMTIIIELEKMASREILISEIDPLII
jgi:hypothetical protein